MIGGGAAGLMASITAAEQGASVTLLEPNERLGKKVNITGKGRCNVTNDSDMEELMRNIPCNARFLYSAFSDFDGRDCMAFFAGIGVELKVERGKRVFPVTDSAFTITDALKKRIHTLGVRWQRERAEEILTENGAVSGVRTAQGIHPADAVILATGGVSYPGTGSTGDGYRMAAALGHTVIPPRASLVPLVSPDPACAAMQGLSLKNVAIKVKNSKGKTLHEDFGEMLFTHFGLSGPMILSASAHIRNWEKESYTVSIDLKPALDEQKLEARLLRDMQERSNQDFRNLLGGLVHKSMIPVLLEKTGIAGDTKVNSVTREERRTLLHTLKDFTVPVTGTRPVEEAIITSGGVKVSEIVPATMASKLVSGLYFAGELIDVDAYTGGFNLQIAWATGRAAGRAAAEEN